MGLYTTLAFTAINIFCLAITILLPNPSTPASLIPIIASACLWIFKKKSGELKLSKRIRLGIIITALAVASMCFLVLLTASIEKETVAEYVFKFQDVTHQSGILSLLNSNNAEGACK